MEVDPEHSRKICPSCKRDFSDRHFRRHILECASILPYSKQNANTANTESNIIEKQVVQNEEISDNEIEIDYDEYKIEVPPRKKNLNNLEDEDIRTYFDISDNVSDSESLGNFSDFEDYESFDEDDLMLVDTVNDRQVLNNTYWFCRLLMLWQCIHYISDTAVSLLLRLISAFLSVIAVSSDQCRSYFNVFPNNLYSLSKFCRSNINFDQYVVCIKCCALYNYSDCHVLIEGKKVTNMCSFVEFPHHRLPHLRRSCGQALLYEVANISSKNILNPYKIFCYKSIKGSLERLVCRNNFEVVCEKWRFLEKKEGIMYDVYDGRIWRKFNGESYNFLTKEGNYGLMLNVDWFQPYKHTNCSIGAIYLAFFNLPREERFKRENMILVGVIPDMKCEPKTNTFLSLLVNELEEAWTHGFYMTSYQSPKEKKCFKLALFCVGCDVPASRKLCGFLGHSATMGCNKCKKEFPGMIGEKNYGGFNRSEWISRTNLSHRSEVLQIKNCDTKGQKETLERTFGTRYSCLLRLEYFDPITMTPIDPMHNLFLGTAKHMISVWKTHKLIDDEKCKMIQEHIEPFSCPSDIGKLPKKFATSFGSFNADQLKNWTLLFSVYALHGILPDSHLECWRKFVLACRRLCSVFISSGNAKVADRLLMEFCIQFESIYGQDFVTPNMHLHGHLYECIMNFGPIYSFWLFSFERENGILGSYKTNKRNIEVQLMKRFLKETWSREKDIEMDHTFLKVFDELSGTARDRGTLGEICTVLKPSIIELSSSCTKITDIEWDVSYGIFAPNLKQCVLNSNDIRHLKNFYKALYESMEFTLCTSVLQGKDIFINGSVLGSKHSRTVRSSYILAFWCNDRGQIDIENSYLTPRPGQILQILKHSIIVNNKIKSHYLAKVQWFKQLPDTMRYFYGKPIEVWYSDLFAEEGTAMYIPVHRIKSRFVYVKTQKFNKNVIVVSPRERHIL